MTAEQEKEVKRLYAEIAMLSEEIERRTMKELRCKNCNKLLCRAGEKTIIEIKCPRCGVMNGNKINLNTERSVENEKSKCCENTKRIL